MKLHILALSLLSGIFSQDLSAASRTFLDRYSLDQLLAAKTFFRAELSTRSSLCPELRISQDRKAQIPQLLEGLINEKIREADGPVLETLGSLKKVQRCRRSCRCGAYADAWEQLPLASRTSLESSPALKRAYEKALQWERQTKTGEVERCARINSWICGSSLLRHLLSQTSQ